MTSTRRRSPWVNLRRSLQVGAWNVLSLREDDHLSLLSSKLKRLDIGIAALSEVQRPDCGEMVGGYTYYCSGRSDGYQTQGVAVAVSNMLTPMIIELSGQRAYYETKDSSILGCHFPGLCIYSD